MTVSIFDIPHINDGVTQYLSCTNLCVCVLVCKKWSLWFSHCLWGTINFDKHSNSEPLLSILERRSNTVQSIVSSNRSVISHIVSLFSFPDLRKFECSGRLPVSLKDSAALEILAKAPSLGTLKLKIQHLEQEDSEQLIQALASHPSLYRLDLSLVNMWEQSFALALLQACKEYRSLRLCFDSKKAGLVSSDGQEDTKSEEDTMTPMQDMKIRDLGIQLPRSNRGRILLVELLEHCPLLRRLELIGLQDIVTLRCLSGYFVHYPRQQLRHLRITDTSFKAVNDLAIADLIQAFSSKSENLVSGISGSMESYGLESFEAISLFEIGERAALTLIQCYASTLTVLNLSCICTTPYPLFTKLASGLPRLKSLKANTWLGSPPATTANTIIMRDTFALSWLCLGLTDLDLRFSVQLLARNGNFSQRSVVESQCAKHIFEQVGGLEELLEWKLDCSIDQLGVDAGLLEKLTGLKKLRVLDLRGCIDFRIGEKEAKWMDANWPDLNHVRACDRNPFTDQLVYNQPMTEFKDALLAKRPWMRFD